MNKSLHFLAANLLILTLLLVSGLGVAEAHVLKQDNGISAVLHIPPEDNPEAGQATKLELSFASRANTFSLQDCNCQVDVTSRKQIIQTASLVPAVSGATLESVSTVNFPAVGVYDVLVQGSAKDDKFTSFQLDYSVRVATAVGDVNQMAGHGAAVVVIGSGSLIVFVMLAVTSIQRGGRYARQPVPKHGQTVRKTKAR